MKGIYWLGLGCIASIVVGHFAGISELKTAGFTVILIAGIIYVIKELKGVKI